MMGEFSKVMEAKTIVEQIDNDILYIAVSNHCVRNERSVYLWKIGTTTFIINLSRDPIDYNSYNNEFSS